jgi:hypothetical protein
MNTTDEGYIRYTDTPYRLQREHRMVARIAWGPRIAFPSRVHVHHMDLCRTHNCRGNLIIIAPELHDARTQRKIRQR